MSQLSPTNVSLVCPLQATEDIPEVQRFPVQRSPSAPPQSGGLHAAPAGASGLHAAPGGGGGLVKKTVTRTVHTKEYDVADKQGVPLSAQADMVSILYVGQGHVAGE